MKTKLKAAVLFGVILTVVVGAFLFLLFRPSVWSHEIVGYLNDHVLTPNGWTLSIEGLHGQLTSDVFVENLYLRKSDGSAVIFSENTALNLNLSQIVSGRWSLSELSMDNAIVTLKPTTDWTTRKLAFVRDLASKGFGIDELNVTDLSLLLENTTDESIYSIDIKASVESMNGKIMISPSQVVVNDFRHDRTIQVSDGRIELSEELIAARGITGSVGEILVVGNVDLSLVPYSRIHVETQIQGISPQRYFGWNLEKLLGTDRLDLQIDLTSDLVNTQIEGSAINSSNESPLGQFVVDFAQDSGNLVLTGSRFETDYLKMSGSGSLLSDGRLDLSLSVDSFDLHDAGLDLPVSIRGTVAVQGTVNEGGIQELYATIDLKNSDTKKAPTVSVSGNLTFSGDVMEIPDSLVMHVGQGRLIVEGNADFSKERADLMLRFEDSEIGWLSSVVNVDSLSGRARGIVDISGYWKDPSIGGDLTLEDVNYDGSEVRLISSSFRINSVMTERNGSLRLIMNDGQIGGYDVERGIADAYVRGDTLHLANGRLEKGGDYFQISGKMIGNERFVVDQLQLAFQEHRLTNLGQFELARSRDAVFLGPVKLRVNEGTVEGSLSLSHGKLKTAKLMFSNLELASLNTLFIRDYPIGGKVFGELAVNSDGKKFEGKGNVVIKTGFWRNIKFDDFQASVSLINDVLYFEEFSLACADKSSFQFNGFVGVTPGKSRASLAVDPDGKVSLTSEFRNFELSLFSEYFPESWSLSGRASGSLAVSGTGSDPEMVYDFAILEPHFGKIKGEKIVGKGRYIDRRLYIENLEGETKAGHYVAEGYLPYNLAFAGNSGDRFLKTDPVSFDITGDTRKLEFLTPYFSSVDSITGRIKLNLNISGTPANPKRNGYISVEKGTVYALLLDSPITNLNGKAVITDNKFIIDELAGDSRLPTDTRWVERWKSSLAQASGGLFFGSKKQNLKPDLRVTGSMDLTEFFEPDLAFLVTGKKVYIRTLLGEIEGIADVDLSITGKDTISIAGDIIPHEAVLRKEFAGAGNYGEVEPAGRVISHYKLHFPIARNLFIRNSQVDAELEGDMSIFKLGNGPYKYSGEMSVLRGKYYYLSDIFDIQEGHLLFDPTRFSPQMDIRATTEIEGIEIQVAMSGDLEEPIVVIEALNSDQYLSQSDLLQLLTIQKRFEEQGISSETLRQQSLNLFGSILENEFQKNFARSSGLDLFEIEGSSSLLANTEGTDLALRFGKRVSSNLYLSYKRSFSLSRPDQVGVEYRINRYISLVGSYDEDGQYRLEYRFKYQY